MRPGTSLYTQEPLMKAPGWTNAWRTQRDIITIGQQLRDVDMFKYPLLPQAFQVYQQLATSREWRIITTKANARGASRAIDYLHNAISVNYYDGTEERGLEGFMRRRSADYLCIGRTLAYWDKDRLEYLDPAYCHLYLTPERQWHYFNDKKYPEAQVYDHKPIPLGGYDGYFVSPLRAVIPTAMLAYLIREHDLAAADGRKLTDVLVTGSRQSAEALTEMLANLLKTWDGARTDSNNVAIMFVDTFGQMPIKDMFHRLGLANIPDDFDRQRFDFYYANEISAAMGLALRHFWSKDEFTNRSLEEINEQRQSVKGPNIYIRSEERMINKSGMLRQFGPSLKFEFIEEVDVATRKARADVLLSFIQGMSMLLSLNNPALTIDMVLDLGVHQGIIPSELRALSGQMVKESEALKDEKSAPLKVDEIALDQWGRVVDYRPTQFHITHVLEKQQEEIELEKSQEPEIDYIELGRIYNCKKFLEAAFGDADVAPLFDKAYNSYEKLTPSEHYEIYQYITNPGGETE